MRRIYVGIKNDGMALKYELLKIYSFASNFWLYN